MTQQLHSLALSLEKWRLMFTHTQKNLSLNVHGRLLPIAQNWTFHRQMVEQYIHTMEYYAAVQKNQAVLHESIQNKSHDTFLHETATYKRIFGRSY